MTQSIIDRDIEFYKGEAERSKERLTRCLPEFEGIHDLLRIRALIVVKALEQYRYDFARLGERFDD